VVRFLRFPSGDRATYPMTPRWGSNRDCRPADTAARRRGLERLAYPPQPYGSAGYP
jgi:hypothetical protein